MTKILPLVTEVVSSRIIQALSFSVFVERIQKMNEKFHD